LVDPVRDLVDQVTGKQYFRFAMKEYNFTMRRGAKYENTKRRRAGAVAAAEITNPKHRKEKRNTISLQVDNIKALAEQSHFERSSATFAHLNWFKKDVPQGFS
jgi:hypothetical protein